MNDLYVPGSFVQGLPVKKTCTEPAVPTAPSEFVKKLKKLDKNLEPRWNKFAKWISRNITATGVEMVYEPRWEIWRKSPDPALEKDTYIMTVFEPTNPPIRKGNFRELDQRTIDFLLQMRIAIEKELKIKDGEKDEEKLEEMKARLNKEDQLKEKSAKEKVKEDRRNEYEEIGREIEKKVIPNPHSVTVGKHGKTDDTGSIQ